ncbi:MAG: D-alanine--D-alanine ligase family protein [Nitrospinota bacterium]
MQKTKVGLIFGGVSAEHEISIITFDQVIRNIDKEKYEPVPIYITLDGDWICDDRLNDVTRYKEIFTGEKSGLKKFNRKILPPYPLRHEKSGFVKKMLDERLEIDVAFPLIHGSGGEDGSLQGLLELADIPYAGSGITASAVGMDKLMQKRILASAGLPVVKFEGYLKSRIESEHGAVREEIKQAFDFPLFVKPASAGSSVGITKVDSADFLAVALDEACRYDRKIIVEQAVENPREINCAVMGDDDEVTDSVCEEVFSEGFLDYKQKYLKGGKKSAPRGGMADVSRTIPADIPEELSVAIRDLAVKVFRALDCSGAARVDFLMDGSGSVTVTELNSIPGSLSFYLWEKSGVSFSKMIDKVIGYAFSNYRRRKMLRRSSGFSAVQRYLQEKDKPAGE